jgi:predicted dehydrogenase
VTPQVRNACLTRTECDVIGARLFRTGYATPESPTRWRLNKSQACSGALGDLVSHTVDLARYLVGEISELSAMLNTFVTRRPAGNSHEIAELDVDAAALALVRFQNGSIGTIEATHYATGRKNFNRFEINGEQGQHCVQPGANE